ncbi:Heme oxygenase (mycobilin-producing) [Lentibacillus sp. JNUCC-1]|uniref:antibiotic biosynthesis monooxygenase family protein n=1 Tax=Lentibacillus sp. JNUCC-1 TaxID=2654513 RepID=UPI0012E95C12|nr:antibiotic biosynthesis monooxygenase [Lentibacillus sp. JNUCC-1]MUV36580.1 Heme oxygenase (mycobilin-producing) [Lentibacillus sp. JNUCC-1]
MHAYMTNGTLDFLLNLIDQHPEHHFYYMENNKNVTVYYESEDKSVFESGRDYEIIAEEGTLKKQGYVVMNNIPVTEEGRPIFEDRFKKNKKRMEGVPGFSAFRLLRPDKGRTYVVLTQWSSETDFENWKTSDHFSAAHADQGTKHPAYFADRPFQTHYHMIDPDEVQD